MFDRLNLMLNEDKINLITNTKILLVGLGGVGGITFEMLIRMGIKSITIIDFDTFDESNLNRQILSNKNNIGSYKTLEAKNRAESIANNVNVKIINKKLNEEIINDLDLNFDYIIDAIDDVKAKILLIKFAIKNNIKIISSCAMGNRFDPLKLNITNIWDTNNDPLARKIRNILRKEKINYKLKVVSSSEIPIKTNYNIGSNCLVPNTAGILLASYVINDIIK